MMAPEWDFCSETSSLSDWSLLSDPVSPKRSSGTNRQPLRSVPKMQDSFFVSPNDPNEQGSSILKLFPSPQNLPSKLNECPEEEEEGSRTDFIQEDPKERLPTKSLQKEEEILDPTMKICEAERDPANDSHPLLSIVSSIMMDSEAQTSHRHRTHENCLEPEIQGYVSDGSILDAEMTSNIAKWSKSKRNRISKRPRKTSKKYTEKAAKEIEKTGDDFHKNLPLLQTHQEQTAEELSALIENYSTVSNSPNGDCSQSNAERQQKLSDLEANILDQVKLFNAGMKEMVGLITDKSYCENPVENSISHQSGKHSPENNAGISQPNQQNAGHEFLENFLGDFQEGEKEIVGESINGENKESWKSHLLNEGKSSFGGNFWGHQNPIFEDKTSLACENYQSPMTEASNRMTMNQELLQKTSQRSQDEKGEYLNETGHHNSSRKRKIAEEDICLEELDKNIQRDIIEGILLEANSDANSDNDSSISCPAEIECLRNLLENEEDVQDDSKIADHIYTSDVEDPEDCLESHEIQDHESNKETQRQDQTTPEMQEFEGEKEALVNIPRVSEKSICIDFEYPLEWDSFDPVNYKYYTANERHLHSFYVVGPRGVGKSSFVKTLAYSMKARASITVQNFKLKQYGDTGEREDVFQTSAFILVNDPVHQACHTFHIKECPSDLCPVNVDSSLEDTGEIRDLGKTCSILRGARKMLQHHFEDPSQDCPDVHVIFLFPPKEISSETGSKLRECASILGTEYPLIPVIAQADTVQKEDMAKCKSMMKSIPSLITWDEDFRMDIPAIFSAESKPSVNGMPHLLRSFSWGTANALNPKHSDLSGLRKLIFEDLPTPKITVTWQRKAYQKYQESSLSFYVRKWHLKSFLLLLFSLLMLYMLFGVGLCFVSKEGMYHENSGGPCWNPLGSCFKQENSSYFEDTVQPLASDVKLQNLTESTTRKNITNTFSKFLGYFHEFLPVGRTGNGEENHRLNVTLFQEGISGTLNEEIDRPLTELLSHSLSVIPKDLQRRILNGIDVIWKSGSSPDVESDHSYADFFSRRRILRKVLIALTYL